MGKKLLLHFSKATDESQRNVFDKSRMRRDVFGALVSIQEGALRNFYSEQTEKEREFSGKKSKKRNFKA